MRGFEKLIYTETFGEESFKEEAKDVKQII